jgi:hypothetical protein
VRRTAHLDTSTDIAAAIAGFVADLTDTEVDELPRIVHAVDTDALETLRKHAFQGSVTFDWCNCHINVSFSEPVFVTVSDVTLDL